MDIILDDPIESTRDGLQRTVFKLKEAPVFKVHFKHGNLVTRDDPPKNHTNLALRINQELIEVEQLWEKLVKQIQTSHSKYKYVNSGGKTLNNGNVIFRFRSSSRIYLAETEILEADPISSIKFINQIKQLEKDLGDRVSFSGFLTFSLSEIVVRNNCAIPIFYVRTLVVKQFNNFYNEDLEDLELQKDLDQNETKYSRTINKFKKLTITKKEEICPDFDLVAPISQFATNLDFLPSQIPNCPVQSVSQISFSDYTPSFPHYLSIIPQCQQIPQL